ncbi:serine protease spb1 [Bdellovibrio bacteriovorus]|uniref:serine protease spb1 n=1 Tax=Bdellovibrio bacteriovorus TaxID=959 RepID=UPI0035A93500
MKVLLLLISIGAFLGCARPDYISAQEWQRLNGNPLPANTCTGEFKALGICARLQWTKTPNSTEAQEFLLELQGDTSLFDDISIILWMPSMGHGSAPVKIEKLSATQYRITNVYFIMPGDWDVRMSLKKSGQTLDQLFIPLMVP